MLWRRPKKSMILPKQINFKRHLPLSPFMMTKRVLPSSWKNSKFLIDWCANAKYSYSCLESSLIHSQCYVYHVNNCLYLHWRVMIHHTICALHIQQCIKAVEIRIRNPEFANLSSHTASSFIAISHLIWNKHVPWKKSWVKLGRNTLRNFALSITCQSMIGPCPGECHCSRAA